MKTRTTIFLRSIFYSVLSFLGFHSDALSQCGGACPPGDVSVRIDVTTDAYGYECYWELVPGGNACGVGTIFQGGNPNMNCNSGGTQQQQPGGYGNNTTIQEGPWCLPNSTQYSIQYVDDWGDGGIVFKVYFNGNLAFTFTGTMNGNTFNFTTANPSTPNRDLNLVSYAWGVDPNTGNTADSTMSAYYTKIPRCHAETDTLTFFGLISNDGLSTQLNVELGVNVTGAGSFSTTGGPASSLASCDTVGLPANSTFTPTLVGTYNITLEAQSDSVDQVPTNNTATLSFEVSDTVYARDNDNPTSGNVFSYQPYVYGNIYEINVPDTVTSLSMYIPEWANPAYNPTGDIISLEVWDFNVATPTVMAQEFYTITAGDLNTWLTLKLGTPLALNPGFYLAAYQTYTDTFLFLYSSAQTAADLTSFIDMGPTGTTWYYTPYVPFVRMNVSSCPPPACAISVSGSSTPDYCSSGSGTGTATVTGGTSPFTYVWSGGGSTATATGLATGSYTVTVTDAAGCSASTSVTVSSATTNLAITSVTTTNDTCSGGLGTATASTSGGTAPFTYVWSPAGSGSTATGLTGGTYDVTVSDSKGCTAASSGVVTDISTNLSIDTITVTDETSCGAGDGSATVTVLGGVGTISYLWSDSSTTSTITGLSAGSYQVTVSDSYGCSDAGVTAVNSAGAQTLAMDTIINVSCNGGSDGEATVTITGGTPPFAYLWSNGQSGSTTGTTITGTGLSAGIFSVNVIGSDSCTAGTGGTISEPTAVDIVDTVTDATCNNTSDGMIEITVSGGTAPYTYNWSNGSPAPDQGSLAAATYTVTVTDANGCTLTNSSVVSAPAAVSGSTTVTDVSCNGGNDGAVNLTPGGGIGTFSFSWSNNATTEDLTGLADGTYTVTITDGNSCTASVQATVTEPIAPLTVVNDSVTTTKIYISVNGGTSGYTYNWSNGSNVQDPTITASGTFTVTVTDSKGCTATLSVVGIGEIPAVATFELNPNPNNGVFNLKMTNPKKNVYSIEIRNILGQIILADQVAFTGKYSRSFDLSKQQKGVYFLKVSNGKDQRTEKIIIY